jgi:sugar phosphate isomerase/epimerase
MKTINTKKAIFIGLMALLLCPVEAFCQHRYKVSACDWMMLKRQRPGAITLAKEIGADGVELDMGPLGKRVLFENQLRDNAETQQKFLQTLKETGIEVSSIAMSGFFAQNLLKRDNYQDLIQDCLNTMKLFDAKVAFLPLGGSGHEWEKAGTPERKELTKRLHVIGEMAKKEGRVIAIRTALDAKESAKILKEAKTKGVKLYYNLQDAVDSHRDVVAEIKALGKKRIAQVHASLTDSVTLDRDPRINMQEVKKALDDIKYEGWLVVERSRDAKKVRDVRGNFGTNVRYLKEVFQKED